MKNNLEAQRQKLLWQIEKNNRQIEAARQDLRRLQSQIVRLRPAAKAA